MAENKNAAEKAPDQNAGKVEAPSTFTQTETQATEKILAENAGTYKNDSTSGNAPTESDSTGLQPNDGSDDGTGDSETLDQKLSREATEAATEKMKSTLKSMGRAAEAAAGLLGLPDMHLFDSNDDADSSDASTTAAKVQETVQQAKGLEADETAEETDEKTEKPDNSEESDVGSAISDFTSWVADGINKYVVQPVTEAISDITEAFDDASQWMFNGSDVYGAAPEALAGLNDVSQREFNSQQYDAMRNFNFDLDTAKDENGEGLRLPENAVESGTVEIGGQKVSVLRTPEGDTYLKRGDTVIGHQKKDGGYELALKDGSKLDFKMTEGKDGTYKLDNLERTKDGKLQQKIADGVFYNYNYDAQGNKASVDAAGDLKGPLSPEKLAAIKKELGDSGAAALRVTDKDQETKRLLLQVHDKDTNSLTDIDGKRAQIFHKDKEYLLNEKDQLGLADSDGKWTAPDATEDPKAAEEHKRIEELAKKVGKRASGESKEAIGGVSIETGPDGSVKVTRVDDSGKTLTTTELPADKNTPISVINSNGEKTLIKGDNVDMRTLDGQQIFNFDQTTGVRTSDMTVDRNGLTDHQTGARLDAAGNAWTGDGSSFGEGFKDISLKRSAELAKEQEAEAEAKIAAKASINLGHKSLGLSVTGNPSVMAAAKVYAMESFGIASAAMMAAGNDLHAQVPISIAIGIAQMAKQQALSGESTQTFASSQGINDSTRLSNLNQKRINSFSTFNDQELVRDSLKIA